MESVPVRKQVKILANKKQRRKTLYAGHYGRIVQYTMNTDPDVRRTRAPRELISSCAQESINLRHSWEKFNAIIATNFTMSDLVITLTYDDNNRPAIRKDAEKKLKQFIRRFRSDRRSQSNELMYMYVTERGHSLGRLHHHMIVNATTEDYATIRSLWRYGDNIDIDTIASKGYDGWARYLTKEPRDVGRHYVGEHMWRSSRNLQKPLTVSQWIDASEPLEAPEGAYILDRQHRENGYGKFDYLEYMIP